MTSIILREQFLANSFLDRLCGSDRKIDEEELSWKRVTYTLLSWLRPPLPPLALDAGVCGEVVEDTGECVEATVGVVDGASSEMDEDVDRDARMLLTRLAATSAWPSPVIVP